MALETSNIYHGPIVRLDIDGDVFDEIGQNNVEITFESHTYDLHDGQQKSGYGIGKIVIELVGTTAAMLNTLKGGINKTTADVKVFTAYADVDDYTQFLISNIMLNYEVKRNFGDDPHSFIVTGTMKALNESNFCARSVATP